MPGEVLVFCSPAFVALMAKLEWQSGRSHTKERFKGISDFYAAKALVRWKTPFSILCAHPWPAFLYLMLQHGRFLCTFEYLNSLAAAACQDICIFRQQREHEIVSLYRGRKKSWKLTFSCINKFLSEDSNCCTSWSCSSTVLFAVLAEAANESEC